MSILMASNIGIYIYRRSDYIRIFRDQRQIIDKNTFSFTMLYPV